MKTFLHVGCGFNRKDKTTPCFAGPEWQEIRLDIDEAVEPDITGSMLAMPDVESESVDAIFSSHNIEHLYPHEVPIALKEFRRVLKPDGYLVLTCPDLQAVAKYIADDKLTDPLYLSPMGPIAPIDILYGFRPSLAVGNHYMAHRSGFTQKVLVTSLEAVGYIRVASKRRERPGFDLWALATKNSVTDAHLTELALAHFPA